MSKHTMIAQLPITFTPVSLTEEETVYPTLEIVFNYVKGIPESGPSYDSGGEPASSAEVEVITVKLIDGDGTTPTQEQINQWAEDWLDSDEGYAQALNVVTDDWPRA